MVSCLEPTPPCPTSGAHCCRIPFLLISNIYIPSVTHPLGLCPSSDFPFITTMADILLCYKHPLTILPMACTLSHLLLSIFFFPPSHANTPHPHHPRQHYLHLCRALWLAMFCLLLYAVDPLQTLQTGGSTLLPCRATSLQHPPYGSPCVLLSPTLL